MSKHVILPTALSFALLCTAAAPSPSDSPHGARGTEPVAPISLVLAADAALQGHTGGDARFLRPLDEYGLERAHRMIRERAEAAEHNSRVAASPRRSLGATGGAKRTTTGRVSRKTMQRPSAATIAVQVAMAQRGKPYVWGATGPSSFDCSGLVQYAYRRAGITLPRTTWDQINAGQRVSTNSLRPGDLVFYRSAAHVAIYVGNGRIVHAPRPGSYVKVAGLYSMSVYAVVRPR